MQLASRAGSTVWDRIQPASRIGSSVWDPVAAVETPDAWYFGPLAGYDIEELDRRGLDQDKKYLKGFKWVSQNDTEYPPEKHPLEMDEKEFSVTEEDQGQKQGEGYKKESQVAARLVKLTFI